MGMYRTSSLMATMYLTGIARYHKIPKEQRI